MTNSIVIYIDEELVEITYRRNEIKRISEVYADFNRLRDIKFTTTLNQIETSVLYELVRTAHD